MSRVFDLLEWLMPEGERFPRAYRGTVTERRERVAADVTPRRLRLYPRVAHRWPWLYDGKYEHVSRNWPVVGGAE